MTTSIINASDELLAPQTGDGPVKTRSLLRR